MKLLFLNERKREFLKNRNSKRKNTCWSFELGKFKWGLSKWGLKVLVHNCPRLSTIVVILRRKFPLEKGPKRPQKCTIVDDCAQIAESGLKPPFESPHLDFLDWRFDKQRNTGKTKMVFFFFFSKKSSVPNNQHNTFPDFGHPLYHSKNIRLTSVCCDAIKN